MEIEGESGTAPDGPQPTVTSSASAPPTFQSTSQPLILPTDAAMGTLSNPPPESSLPSSSSQASNAHEAPVSDEDQLLPPPGEPSTDPPPSSRSTLSNALELAREAVQLDTANDNPEAIRAYRQSVALLSQVIERVRTGAGNTEPRSVAVQEEEIRRLQNIHDTYADRMNILNAIYSIPAVPHSSPSMDSVMTDSSSMT